MTADNDPTRAAAVHCLAATLASLELKLSRQDVAVLVDFLLAKLDDKCCVIYVGRALVALVALRLFAPPEDNYKKVLDAVASRYDPKAHLAAVRYEFFALLETLLSAHSAFITSNLAHSDSFVKAFIHVATGEKDPRNLLLLFELNARVNRTFAWESANSAHEEFTADLFDVCFCYFPISFTPPANDPYKITADQLKTSLRATIASQSLFAKDAFSSLFEKLTSTNPVVRNDVLKTLLACVQNYDADMVAQYWVTIWNALKFEVLHNDMAVFKPTAESIVPEHSSVDDTDENKVLMLTVDTLTALAGRLAESDQLDNFLQTISSELKENVASINEKTFKQSVVLLAALGSISLHAFNYVVDFLFSHSVWGRFVRSDFDDSRDAMDIEEKPEMKEIDFNESKDDVVLTTAKQRALIDNLGFVFSAYKLLLAEDAISENSPDSLLLYKDHLLIFVGQLLQTSSSLEKTLKCLVIQQLVKMLSIGGFLNSQEYTLVFGWLNENLSGAIDFSTKGWENDLILTTIVDGLTKLTADLESTEKARASDLVVGRITSSIIEIILPPLVNYLDNYQAPNYLPNLRKVLGIVETLCVSYQLLEVFFIRLLNKLQFLGTSSIPSDEKTAIFEAIINSLIRCFTMTQRIKQFLTNSWYKNFLPRFMKLVVESDDYLIYELGATLIGLIIKYIDKPKHQAILDDFVGVFVLNKPQFELQNLSILELKSPLIGIFNGILSSVDKSTSIEKSIRSSGKDVYGLIQQVSNLCYDNSDDYIRIGYLQNVALLVNKFTKPNDGNNGELLSKLHQQIKQRETETLTNRDIETFEVFVWIVKALVLRTDKHGFENLNLLVDFLASSNNGYKEMASQSLAIIMGDVSVFTNTAIEMKKGTKIISGVSNLNVKLLYKQQVFEITLPKIVSNYSKASVLEKETYLVSLSVMLDNIPSRVLKPQLGSIMPLILNGLDANNSVILKAALSTFKVIIGELSELIVAHLASLVPKLTALATVKTHRAPKELVNTEDIRSLALECLLGIFSTVELTKVVPFQKVTITKLVVALDDKKRSVRKLASDVRQVLYELGR